MKGGDGYVRFPRRLIYHSSVVKLILSSCKLNKYIIKICRNKVVEHDTVRVFLEIINIQ